VVALSALEFPEILSILHGYDEKRDYETEKKQ
jgi:hypothetical protein